jgi:hypothetical protein
VISVLVYFVPAIVRLMHYYHLHAHIHSSECIHHKQFVVCWHYPVWGCENDSESDQLWLSYVQVDTVGQRGFRRRCLDFDASGARRKSLGSMGNRKSLGSRLKDSGGSSTIADGPQSVLTDMGTTSSSGMQVPVHDLSNVNTNESLRAESMSASARGMYQ